MGVTEKPESRENKGDIMKKLKIFLATILIAIAAASCSLSTEDLATEVQKSMEVKFKPEEINITSFVLTKKGGNEYSGVLDTKEPNGEFTYIVQVIYDGENMTWEVKP